MAQLTSDQKIAISADATYLGRIAEVLREKAQYWYNNSTPNRSDVNRRTQKRKQLSKSILQSNWVSTYKDLVAQYWIVQYVDDPPVLDGQGIPTTTAISNAFDPTYDYWAGVKTGDDTLTEIEW